MKSSRAILISIFLLLIFFATSCETEEKGLPVLEPLPKIKFAETEHDFGEADQKVSIEHIYKFQNIGTAPLLIKNVRSTCGCTVPKWPKEPIPPGGTGEIKVIFKTGTYLNKVKKTIHVITNDPLSEDVPITIGGFVRAYIVVRPTNLNFGKIPFSYPYKRKIRIFPDRAKEVKVKRVYGINDSFFIFVQKDFVERGRKGIELEVGIKGNYIGRVNGKIVIELDDEKMPKITVPVSADIKSEINVNRSNITIRQKRKDFRAQMLLVYSDETPFKIKSAKAKNPNIKVTVTELKKGSRYAVIVWLDAEKVKPGLIKDELIIKTSHEKVKMFKIKLQFQVMK